jgi:hypothetical protein
MLDQSRFKACADRLADKDDAVRDREVEALVAIGQPAVPLLTEILSRTNVSGQAKESAAKALGRMGSPEAVDALLGALSAQQFRTAVGMVFALGACMVPMILSGSLLGASICLLPFAFFAFAAIHLARRQREGTKALAGLREPRSIGMMALATRDKKMARTVLPLLANLLPLATAQHAAALSKSEHEAVIRLLGQPSDEVVRGALHVVGWFDDEVALAAVQAVLTSGRASLAADAEAAAAKIRGRIEQTKDRQTLLRASSSVDGIAPDQLLRPAAPQPDAEPTQLLRSTDQPEN